MNFNINDVLEIVNGNLFILRLEFLVFLLLYLWKQGGVREMTVGEWFLALPLGMAVALSMFVQNIGELGRTGVVWLWRVLTDAKVPLSETQLGLLCAFAVVCVAGLLMMIRTFSKPFFGNAPWVVCGVIAVLFTIVSIVLR